MQTSVHTDNPAAAETPAKTNPKTVVTQLNKLLEMELSGVTRYLHYSFMVFGANRIPIVAWFREQANEGVAHSVLVGEKITAYDGEPSVAVPSGRRRAIKGCARCSKRAACSSARALANM